MKLNFSHSGCRASRMISLPIVSVSGLRRCCDKAQSKSHRMNELRFDLARFGLPERGGFGCVTNRHLGLSLASPYFSSQPHDVLTGLACRRHVNSGDTAGSGLVPRKQTGSRRGQSMQRWKSPWSRTVWAKSPMMAPDLICPSCVAGASALATAWSYARNCF